MLHLLNAYQQNKLTLNREVYTQTMLMARYLKIA